jgi:hypothetical protein
MQDGCQWQDINFDQSSTRDTTEAEEDDSSFRSEQSQTVIK